MTTNDRLAEIKTDLSEIFDTGELSLSEIAGLSDTTATLVAALEAVLEATSKRHGPEVSQQYEMAMETIEDIITEALGASQ